MDNQCICTWIKLKLYVGKFHNLNLESSLQHFTAVLSHMTYWQKTTASLMKHFFYDL